jgi:hypothetical protein
MAPRPSAFKRHLGATQVCPETLLVLANHGIEVEVLQTEAAVKRFNELRETVPVGGLFHSTC